MDLKMVMDNKSGPTVRNMKVIGRMIKLMVEDASFMLMATSTMEIGSTIKPMDRAAMYTLTEPPIKENGEMINNTARESKHGLMGLNMMENTLKAKSMATEL